MKKGTIISVLLFSLLATRLCLAQIASQYELAWHWDPVVGEIEPIGKYIIIQPLGRNKATATVVLQGALPDTVYDAGFNIFGPSPGPGPAVFGVPKWTEIVGGDVCGNIGGASACASLYRFASIITDQDGDGSAHINLNNLPPGIWDLVFWAATDVYQVDQITGTSSWGGASNGYVEFIIP